MDYTSFLQFEKVVNSIYEVHEGTVEIALSWILGSVVIEAVWSHRERGAGHASSAMKALCVLADAYAVEMKLEVHPITYDVDDLGHEGSSNDEIDRLLDLDRQSMTVDALEAWYRRLGFERIDGLPENAALMARLPRPCVLYHSSPVAVRDSISKDGLLLSASHAASLAKESGEPDWRQAGAVFLSTVPEDNPSIDVWSIDATGLHILPDDTTACPNPGETWWMMSEDVPAERLRMHAPSSVTTVPRR